MSEIIFIRVSTPFILEVGLTLDVKGSHLLYLNKEF